MEKGINLQIQEFKESLAITINNAKMPTSIIEMVLKEFLSQATLLNQAQLEQEKKQCEEGKNKANE